MSVTGSTSILVPIKTAAHLTLAVSAMRETSLRLNMSVDVEKRLLLIDATDKYTTITIQAVFAITWVEEENDTYDTHQPSDVFTINIDSFFVRLKACNEVSRITLRSYQDTLATVDIQHANRVGHNVESTPVIQVMDLQTSINLIPAVGLAETPITKRATIFEIPPLLELCVFSNQQAAQCTLSDTYLTFTGASTFGTYKWTCRYSEADDEKKQEERDDNDTIDDVGAISCNVSAKFNRYLLTLLAGVAHYEVELIDTKQFTFEFLFGKSNQKSKLRLVLFAV
jgi:hypothetical protein